MDSRSRTRSEIETKVRAKDYEGAALAAACWIPDGYWPDEIFASKREMVGYAARQIAADAVRRAKEPAA